MRRRNLLLALAAIPGVFLGSAIGDVVADRMPSAQVEPAAVVETVATVEIIHIVPLSPVSLPVCTTEDDPRPCYWDATRQGNLEGRSFISLGEGQARHYYEDLTLTVLPEYAHARQATIAGVSYIVA